MNLPDRTILVSWRSLANPADLVLRVWDVAVGWTPSDRDAVPSVDLHLQAAIRSAVRLDDGNAAVAATVDALLAGWPAARSGHAAESQAAGELLAFLAAADELFRLVHPRTARLAPGATARPSKPSWLERLEFQRNQRGWYAADAAAWLVDHGPLKRIARSADASYANNLADCFSAISVCPRVLSESGRRVGIEMHPVGGDAGRGVPCSGRSGGETITFVAVAEDATDLEIEVSRRRESDYVDVRPKSNLDACSRIAGAVNGCDAPDLVVCPELTVSDAEVDRLCTLLSTAGRKLARVVLAGSGLSTGVHEDGRSWNEARLLNASGAVLVRQKKVWPFGMARERADQYGIAPPGGTGLVMEDVASGTEVAVVDLTEFGRVVILICQDFEAQPLTSDLVRDYQPDWVLVPILDLPPKDFGWTNNRSFALSGYSQARFVVSNSLSLWHRAGNPGTSRPAIGMLVGPRDPAPDLTGRREDASREFALAVPDTTRSPHHATLTWRDGSAVWRKMALRTE